MDSFTSDIDEDTEAKRLESEKEHPDPSKLHNFVSDLRPGFDIKSYMDSHPSALKGLFSGYTQDIEELLDSLGPARGLAESKIKEKCPWLWSAVYDDPDTDLDPLPKPKSHSKNGNGYRPDPDPDQDNDEEDQDIDQDTWREAMEYALSLRDDHIPPGVISDKLYKHYGIDLHHTQISKTLNEYRLDQRADRYDTLYKPQIRTRTNDSILLKVSSLMADKKGLLTEIEGLRSKLDLLQNPSVQKVGIIRKLARWLY